MDTYFAPAQRTEKRKFRNQIADISENIIMNTLLKTAAGLLVVLNEDRQIVALNHAFLEGLGIKDVQDALGLRLGESLSCIHAFEEPAGCGTTEYCVSCGAAIAMMAAIQDNQTNEQICALVSDRDGIVSDICLKVKAEPIQIDNNRWIIFYAQDITQQQFWINLDHVFFHDINNTLTALYGNVQLFEMADPDNENIKPIRQGVERLINEVAIQRNFSQHKDATYVPKRTTVSLGDIKMELGVIINGHKASLKKKIIEDWPEQEVILETDALLLSRILGNMVINALEATQKGGSIRISVTATQKEISWSVWNKIDIPDPIQKRIFQRHFSSKPGDSRGLGTYSMKLFGEAYLKGKISFHSTVDQGTVFTFTLPFHPM
ncbi:MAG: HAMP domain-containing histidine kinase [Proteobacteria bacterium]|nr:HAMP domain-containing histidine kinase [Desulfobacula sp.]MBU3954329.1 HAMP domain-containing histidine kinase [Pseudomonadota bacterium]MBU4129357.1 HAMP domain-containing histidine kinase [Pseudomonadota bacterium]